MPIKKNKKKLKKTTPKKQKKTAAAKKNKKNTSSKRKPKKKASSAKKPVQKKLKQTTPKKQKKKTLKKTRHSSSPLRPAKKTVSSNKKKKPAAAAAKKNKKSQLNFLEEELQSILKKSKQVIIKNPDGTAYCFEENCDQPASTAGYCRYHYISYWKQLKMRAQILSENKIQQRIQKIIKSHSSKVLDYMLRDLSNEKDFSLALSEMKISNTPPSALNEF